MRMSRSPQVLAALVALVSILFMQFAVAAYACPALANGDSGDLQIIVLSENAGTMSDCEGLDLEKPNLCQADGQKREISLDKPALQGVPAFAPASLVSTVTPAEVAVPAKLSLVFGGIRARTSAPPLAIRNCCFRI